MRRMENSRKSYHVLVQRDEDWYIGHVLDREGVTTQGRTLEEFRLYIAKLAILLLGAAHLCCDGFRLLIQPVPVAVVQKPHQDHDDQHLQFGRAHVAHFHRGQ